MPRRPDAQRYGGEEDQHQRGAGQLQRGGQKAQHVIQHRTLGGERNAKIQMQRLPQPAAVLDDKRPLQPQHRAG